MNAFFLLCVFIAIAASSASFNSNSKWLSLNGGAAAKAATKAAPVKKDTESVKKAADLKKKADAEAKKLADKVKAVSYIMKA